MKAIFIFISILCFKPLASFPDPEYACIQLLSCRNMFDTEYFKNFPQCCGSQSGQTIRYKFSVVIPNSESVFCTDQAQGDTELLIPADPDLQADARGP
jgi:hypothetical protein